VEFQQVVEVVGKGVDAVGVAVIVLGALAAAVRAALTARRGGGPTYRSYRQQLGRSILWGWSSSSPVTSSGTVAITPTFTSVGVLAVIGRPAPCPGRGDVCATVALALLVFNLTGSALGCRARSVRATFGRDLSRDLTGAAHPPPRSAPRDRAVAAGDSPRRSACVVARRRR
jgi:uncharacterized membrane protein